MYVLIPPFYTIDVPTSPKKYIKPNNPTTLNTIIILSSSTKTIILFEIIHLKHEYDDDFICPLTNAPAPQQKINHANPASISYGGIKIWKINLTFKNETFFFFKGVFYIFVQFQVQEM